VANFVVDVNIVLKWLLEERHSREARLFLDSTSVVLLAPAFLLIEAANILSFKVRQKEVESVVARYYLASLTGKMSFVPDSPLLAQAFAISSAHACSVYDCLYVGLALREDCQFVTADEKLIRMLGNVYPGRLLWLGDVTAEMV
jgi:predicted nucleic acid-binding protein